MLGVDQLKRSFNILPCPRRFDDFPIGTSSREVPTMTNAGQFAHGSLSRPLVMFRSSNSKELSRREVRGRALRRLLRESGA